MGEVYRARDTVDGRAVALKFRGAFDPAHNDRFLAEARILSQLAHPAIVGYLGHGATDAGEAYIVMDWLEGIDLAARLRRGRCSVAEAVAIARRVAEGLAAAHARGLVHRDIKPGNVMLVGEDPAGATLVDFGVARAEAATRALTRTGAIVGTAGYMAPEQIEGRRDIDARADVFALGALLYEIVSGHPPYYGESHAEVRELAARADIVPLENIVPGGHVPSALSRIVRKATEREPSQRYAGVSQLARDIERFRRGGLGFGSRRFEAGEIIVREGDHGQDAFVITHGKCVAYKTLDHRKVVLREMGPGDVFGEMAVFSSRPRSASVEALEATVVRVVGRHLLQEGLGLDTWMGAFVRALTDRFREVEEKLERLERARTE